MSRRSEYEIDERAAEATFLINHPLMREAFDMLHSVYVNEMTATQPGGPESVAAHAKVKVLQEVELAIRSIIMDKKLADKKGMKYD